MLSAGRITLRFATALRAALAGAALSVLSAVAPAAPPDSPPDAQTLTTGLGIGILYEPVFGAGPDGNISDRYLTTYGDEIERRGFRTVRLRIAMEQFSANATGTYPHLQLNEAFFTDLQAVVDDLLRRHNNTMYVLISPNGLESGSADDSTQMTDYWDQIARRFQNYTHRLIFNLMNEPYFRTGEFTSLAQIQSLYDSATTAIRRSNPTRYLVYLQLNDVTIQPDGTRAEGTPYSAAGPGETDFNHLVIPAEAGPYFIVDFHALGTENSAGTAKRFALMRQAAEYRTLTGHVVWSGAWNFGAWESGFDQTELTKVADEMKRLGLPGTYLMFNSSNTSLFDGNGTDRDADGVLNEWTRSADADLIAARNPIFWQKNEISPETGYRAGADSYTKSNLPDEAIVGETQELQVRNIRTSYVRFNVNRVPAGVVTSAKLRVRTNSLSAINETVTVHAATGNTWTERTLSWNNAPSTGSALDSQPITATETWHEFDVTAAVSGAGTYTFALKGTSLNLVRFYSRDADRDPSWLYGPELVVTVTPTAPANRAPQFSSSSVSLANAEPGVAYGGTLATHTIDPDGDALRFGKSTGPIWLTIAQDGTLSGTPRDADLGSNSWVVEVSDGRGGTARATLTLNVSAAAPAITSQPTAQVVAPGSAVTLTVAASGTPSLTYQWFKNGSPLAGATSPTLSFSAVQPADAGNYAVLVTNGYGSASSAIAALAISAPAAHVFRLAPGTTRAWAPDAIGVNGQSINTTLRNNPFSDPNNLNLLSREMVNSFRYPGGTTANYWDWVAGRRFADTGNFTLANLKVGYDALGFTPHFVLNLLTPTTSTAEEKLSSALAMLTSAQQIGLPIERIELGNEFYLSDPDYVAAFPSGREYGAMCQTWITAIKARFPAAKCGIAVTMETRARLNTWSAEVLATCTNYDALIVHWYCGSGHDPTVPAGNGTADEQATQWNSFTSPDGVSRMLGAPQAEWSTLAGQNDLPSDKEIWVTEFNLQDSNGAVRQTWAHGLFLANQFHALLRDARITRLSVHNWAGTNKSLAFLTSADLAYVLTNHGQGSLTTTPYHLAAPGLATRAFAEVADGANSLTPLTIEFASDLTPNGMPSYPAIYGWQFGYADGSTRAVLVNTSGTDRDVYLGGIVSTAARLRQISGVPTTYVTGENSTLTHRTSVDTPTTLRLPAYSLTTLGAVADLTSFVPSPAAPIFSSATIVGPAATALRHYTQSLLGLASDPDGSPLVYRKVAGPTWLTVWNDGTLSGLPDLSHVGANTFTVEAIDPAGNAARATVQIQVDAGSLPAAPALASRVIAPSADTFIYAGAQSTIPQTLDGFLDVRSNSSTTFARLPYLKFRVADLPGQISSAVLSLYSVGVNSSVTVYETGADWKSTTLTWDNRPDFPGHGRAIKTQTITPGWNQIDLSSLITGAGTYSIALNESSGTLQQFHSSRGANPPSLTLTFVPPVVTYAAPSIITPPVNQARRAGESAAFAITATATPTATYQWFKDDRAIAGATGATLTLPNLSTTDAGLYTVRVSNLAGGTTSAPVSLTVAPAATTFATWRSSQFDAPALADPAISGLTADPDQDGASNLLEYALGTDPLRANGSPGFTVAATETEWIFTYDRPADRSDLVYEPELSTTLQTWAASGLSHNRIATGTNERWEARAPRSAGASVFFRLRVSTTP